MKENEMIVDIEHTNPLTKILNEIEFFEIIRKGKITKIEKNNPLFKLICENVENLFLSSRLEPAFGVSLHNETLKELECDDFLKIKFSKSLTINDLPFESLLIKLEDSAYGCNIIRENNSDYFGRCFYLFFNDMQNLQNLITDK